MTDNEIKKALECCADEMGCAKGCPFFDKKKSKCKVASPYGAFEKLLLDLINRQQAEIERLTLEYAGFRAAANQILDIDKLLGSIKADVISTINARLYAYKTNIYIKGEELIIIPSSDYELILKEMVGDAE